MIPVVVDVEHVGPYRLRLTFADGVHGEVDISRLVRFEGVFASLRDPAEFRKAHVDEDSGTVAWPGGADIDPLMLYATIKRVDPSHLIAAKASVSD